MIRSRLRPNIESRIILKKLLLAASLLSAVALRVDGSSISNCALLELEAVEVAQEVRGRLLGEGASGKVYIWNIKLANGSAFEAVRKDISTDERVSGGELTVELYRRAAEMGWGPNIVALKTISSWFRGKYFRIYLERIPGISLAQADWMRNSLPEPQPKLGQSLEQSFVEFRRHFGPYVIVSKAIEKLSLQGYAALIEKFNQMKSFHPDPNPENIIMTTNSKGELEIRMIDWEAESAGQAQRILSRFNQGD